MDRSPIDVQALRQSLPPEWRRVDAISETGSTNADLIARKVRGENIAGAVLLAEHQTAGRGRHGRRWSAPAGSQIAMSVGVDATGVPAEAWGWLPLLTGLAVVEAIREAGVEATLKWPNDVLVGSRKLAGILAEVSGNVIVVGVGVNVSLAPDELPDPRAVSLSMLGIHVERTTLTTALLTALSQHLTRWHEAGGADAATVADYRRVSATIGARVRAVLPGETEIVGTALGIDDSGRLLIDDRGVTVPVSAGDLTHLRPAMQ